MLLHLHIGTDKTGSTAIQRHFQANRDWIQRRAMFVPTTGNTPTGHVLLFNKLEAEPFEKLHKELKAAEGYGFDHVFLSWEGICWFTADELETLKALLQNHQCRIYIYLREQSEIIQTGYFQNVRDTPQRVHIDDFTAGSALLFSQDRLYDLLLDKFALAFGAESLRIRIYDRLLLKGNNIVIDMLDLLGLEPDEDFLVEPSLQNPSLCVASVKILNMLDPYYPGDIAGHSRLVDALLNDVAVRGAVGKYFLAEQELAFLRNAYAESNRRVVARYMPADWPYPDLFPHAKRAELDVDAATVEAGIQVRLETLGRLKRFWTWDGRLLEGNAIEQIALPIGGWPNADEAGCYSHGTTATIRFRLMWRHRNIDHARLRLTMAGAYHQGYNTTGVVINGQDYGETDLSRAVFEVPLSSIDAHGLTEITLHHRVSSSTSSETATATDDNAASFCLARIGYTLGN